MKDVDVRHTRNFALIGHAHDGKTSVGEALLHEAGATPSLGRVDDGSSVLDFQPEEKERHSSLQSAVFGYDARGHHLTLVDTPGDPNFAADGEIALAALDGAVLVVSAVDGAKVGTERMARTAEARGVRMLAFVNGMDRERADFEAAVESLRKLEMNAVPIALPIGAESGFRGVVELLSGRARTAAGEEDPPAELADAVEAARSTLVEAVAESDDELLEKYLEAGELSAEELRAGLVAATHAGRLVPVLCGAATAELGIGLLQDAIVQLLPSPVDCPPLVGTRLDDGAEVEVTADPEGPLAAVVFKTVIDRYAGTLSIFRIYSGTVRPDTTIQNATRGSRERLGKLLLMRGAEHVDVPEAGPGDIVAVAKLKDVHTGDALTREKGGIKLPPLPIPQGVISYAFEARSKGDEDKVFSSLARLVEEDPTLQLARDESTGEFLLTGMGELHVRSTVQKLKRLFGVDVELKTPKVPYRETITRRVEHVEGKLKKQTGGKGMFGVCYLTVEPLERGRGIEFLDEIVGGAIPRGLIPAVEKGILEAAEKGPLAGFPVVDVRVRCVDGKHHSVDSNEMAFKLAGSFGFKAAVEKAGPTLLEPVMNVEIQVPTEYVGDIMGDVSSRRGRVQSSEAKGSSQVIKAQIPMAEMLEYASALTSMTGGKGAFQMSFSHYEEVPAQIRERVIAEARAREAAEA